MNIDFAWKQFLRNETIPLSEKKKLIHETPKCSPLYISTKTQICFLTVKKIALNELFWKIKILPYYKQQIGILKKQMKILIRSKEEEAELQTKLSKEKCVKVDEIKKIINPNSRMNKYKDIKKLNIGMSKKDILSSRRKKTSAFYNCIVLIIRIFRETFREFHVKIFNTGKMEIPGIQKHEDQAILFEKIIEFMQPYFSEKIEISPKVITVLINSNFSCNFYINRNNLYNLLKYKYNINSIYDPCSYPGIQAKFYFKNKITDGICHCKQASKRKKCCSNVSCMFFRTGSVLIVGNSNERNIYEIYNYIKNILTTECLEISTLFVPNKQKKEKKKKIRKLYVFV